MPEETKLERKIYFYWVNAGRDTTTGDRRPFDANRYLEIIRSLAPGEDGLYMPVYRSTDHLLGVVDELGKHPKMRWVRARRADLPEVELAGQFDYLNIDERAGLADKSHVVFFEDNVIGADFNSRAPRMTALARYLIKKADSPNLAIEYLVARDVLQRLDNLESIHLLDLRVTDPQLSSLSNTPFFGSFQAMMSQFGAYDVEVILRKKGRTSEDLKGLKGILKRLARSANRRQEGAGEASPEKLRVHGRTTAGDELEELDLLNSRLHAVESIQRIQTRSRVLDSLDSYRAIEAAYKEMRDEIKSAVSYRLAAP